MSDPDPMELAEVSKSRRWQLLRIAAGCCESCGRPRGDSPSRTLCRDCRARRTACERRRAGCKPWVPGGKGRPPKE